MVISACDEISVVEGLVAKEQEALNAMGYGRVEAVLAHFPRRYEDRRRFENFPTQATSSAVCLRGMVVDAGRRGFGGSKSFFEAVVLDGTGGVFGTGKLTCRWFNMPFIHRWIACGQEIVIYGKVKEFRGRWVMDHPDFEVLREDEPPGESLHVERIVPIYRNIAGISQRRLREIMHGLLTECDPRTLASAVPLEGVPTRGESMRSVHFPGSMEEVEAARRRFALEEFFGIQLNVVWRRARHLRRQGRVLGRRTVLLGEFYRSLPFDFTGAQKRTIREIIGDMRKPEPMRRLLQGDVGSGKTLVAVAAMVLAMDSGCQAVLMAPTQILAEQHFLTFRKFLEPLGVVLALRTGSRQETSHAGRELEAQMVIGTHALIYDHDLFRDVGLVVIDEQHKFGVEQRELLVKRGVCPDVLVMTATPIPRTLTMTVYGDLDVSVLDEKPPGRGKVVTAVRSGAKQTDINAFVKEQLAQGRQAYLVYPLVEESERLQVESAVEAFEKWRKRLAPRAVGLIHGKLRPEEKEEVMKKFRDGEISALVATSVIEVGVDVPNASVMILHHAERFGLAQLHQLRGRIGRGGNKGYCVLLTDGKSSDGMAKLKVLEETSDGFEIAEADLRLRGPGDVLGSQQSGLSDLRFADFLGDTSLLREARDVAERVLARDPELVGEHAALRSWIQSHEAGEDATSGGA